MRLSCTLLLFGVLSVLCGGSEPEPLRPDQLPQNGGKCKDFDCAAKGMLKLESASFTYGNDEQRCCKDKSPTCNKYACPGLLVPVQNARDVVGSDASTCCRNKGSTCLAYKSCDWSTQTRVGNSETVQQGKEPSKTCCIPKPKLNCGSWRCEKPQDSVRVPDAENVEQGSNPMQTCCRDRHGPPGLKPEDSCAKFNCKPFGKVLLETADFTEGNDEHKCCRDPATTCAQFDCKDDDRVADAAHVSGDDTATCCKHKYKTCAQFECDISHRKRLKPNAADIQITDTDKAAETCCDSMPGRETCAKVNCASSKMVPRPNANLIFGMSPEDCCVKNVAMAKALRDLSTKQEGADAKSAAGSVAGRSKPTEDDSSDSSADPSGTVAPDEAGMVVKGFCEGGSMCEFIKAKLEKLGDAVTGTTAANALKARSSTDKKKTKKDKKKKAGHRQLLRQNAVSVAPNGISVDLFDCGIYKEATNAQGQRCQSVCHHVMDRIIASGDVWKTMSCPMEAAPGPDQ